MRRCDRDRDRLGALKISWWSKPICRLKGLRTRNLNHLPISRRSAPLLRTWKRHPRASAADRLRQASRITHLPRTEPVSESHRD